MIDETTAQDKWWACLTVTEKERIASKVSGQESTYPACTEVWNSLSQERKAWIKAHCEKKHGHYIPEWQEGQMFSE